MAEAYEAKAEELYNFSDKLYRMGNVAWGVENLANHYEVEGVAEPAAKVKEKLLGLSDKYRHFRVFAKDNQEAILAVDIDKVTRESEAALIEEFEFELEAATFRGGVVGSYASITKVLNTYTF